MIITREKGMRMWGGGSGSTSASGVNGGGGFSLAVTEGEGTGNAYTGFTYESGVLSLIKGTQFVTTDFFNRLFTAYDANGTAIVPNDTTTAINNLKLMVGTLSALGKNSEEGGGGTGTVTSVKIASNPDVFIDPVDGIIDMSSYAATWNNKQNAISDLATIRSNASNGNTAYSWGNHANAGYALASNTVSNVAYNTTGKKLTKTINGNTTDIVTAAAIVTDGGGAKASTTITAGNGLTGGGDLSSNRTINVVSANAAITVNADNIKLNVINDYTTTTNNTIIPLAAARGKDLNDRLAVLESWFEVDADGNVKTKDKPNGTHRGFYTESFVSALGSNSDGGGSGAGLEDVWDSLTNQQGTVITDNTKIAIAHIPDTSSTYGYLKASSLNGYATQTWVNQQGFLTTHQSIYALTLKAGGTAVTTFTPNSADASLDFVAGSNISLTRGTNQITIANTYSYTLPLAASGTRGGVQIGYSETNSGTSTTRNYAVKLSSEKMYVNVPWENTTYESKAAASGGTAVSLVTTGEKYTWNNKQDAISDLSTIRSNASNGNTAYGYFTSGAANNVVTTADTTNTLYVVGVTSSATTTLKRDTSITIKGNALSAGSVTTTGNVSVGGTLGVTGATTLSSTLSVASGITLTTTKKIYFGDTSHYLELNSTGFHFSHGVYSDGFVSALGANSSGGGGGGIDIEAMWTELQGNTGTYANAKINVNHIPDISSTYGYAKTSQLGNYLPLSGGTLTGTLTAPKIRINTRHSSGDTRGGIYYYNGTTDYLLIGQGSANLWIGANETDGTHHTGGTYISAGSGSAYISRLVNSTRGNYLILDAGNYSSYALPLSGGTLQKSSGDTPLYIKSTNTSGAYIGYQLNDGTTMGFIGVHATYGASYVKSGTVYPIMRSDNFGGYAYALYGGTDLAPTSTNTINLNDLRSTGSYYVSTNTSSQYVTNKPDDTQDYVFRVWVSAPCGTSGYRRQRFQYLTQMAIYERFYSTDTSTWGNWYKVQDNLANYASASSVTTLQGYFTNGVANSATTASKLSTVSKTAWGQTYWTSGGVPTNISGDMSSVGTITFSEANAVNIDKYGNLKFKSDSSTSYWQVATYSGVVGIVVKNSDGYVGIGTTTPAYKLDVNGDASAKTFHGALDGNAASTTALKNLYNSSTRPTSANLTHITNGGVQHFKATSSMTEGKPVSDAHILHFHWDGDAYDAQMAITTAATPTIQYRTHATSGNTFVWGSWITALTSSNYSSYALPLTGGTITGNLAVRGYIYLRDNNKCLYTSDTADNVQNTLVLDGNNHLLIGYGQVTNSMCMVI